MKRLFLLLAILFFPLCASAQNPTSAPATRYWMGPSLGDVWRNSASTLGGVNSQVGTTYTILATDAGKLIIFNNAGAVAVTLPAATVNGFGQFTRFWILNLGAGTVTVTPTTSTINGGATKTYAQNASGTISSDGTNYFAY